MEVESLLLFFKKRPLLSYLQRRHIICYNMLALKLDTVSGEQENTRSIMLGDFLKFTISLALTDLFRTSLCISSIK